MTVAFVSASAWFDGATGLTADKVITLPSHSTGDLILVLASWKTYTITAQIADAGWNEITEFAEGAVASGNGTGSMKVGAWYKVATSGAETNPTLDFSTGTGLVGEACALVFSQTLGSWATPTFSTGPWASSAGPVTVNATSGTVTLPLGGAVVALVGISDDSATFTRTTSAIASTGGGTANFGTYQEQPATHASTTTGNDMAADAGYSLITGAGSNTTLRTTIAALTAAETGAILWVILNDVAASVTVTPTTAALVATKFAPTVTASDHQLVTVPAAGGSGYSAAVLASSPVAYWRTGEASGSVLDSIGSAHGTTAGTVTRDVTGLLNNDNDGAIDFDGTTGRVSVADQAPLRLVDTFSIETWVKADAWSGWSTLVSKRVSGTEHYAVQVNASGKVELWMNGGSAGATSTATLSTGTTYHVVVTKTGTTRVIYVNGVAGTTLGTNTTGTSNTGTLYLGARDASAEFLNGVLDEVALYTTALSAGTVLAHYDAGIASGGLVLATFAPTVTVAAAADPQLVTPTTATLTVTKFAPTVTATDNQLVTPTTKAAVLATFAPVVTATDLQLVTPTTKTLTLATFAPVVSTPERATPSTVSLALTTFAPSISVSDNQAAIPTTKALTLATFAPTVTATDPQLVTPTTKAVTLTTFAPTVTAAAHQQVTPSTTALTLQAFAPSVTASDQQAVTPTTKALTLVTFAPTVLTPERVTPATKTLALTTFAPTITNPDPQLVTPTTKSLTITKYAPSVGVSDAASIVPPNAALSLTTYAPTVIQPDPQLVTPTTPALELHTFEPLVSATAHQAVIPTTAALVTARMVPTVTATANQSATPTTKALTLTAYAPQVTVNNIVATVTIGLTLTTFAPTVTAGTNTYAFPDPASLTLTGYAPFIDLSAFKLVTPATAVLVITTYPPTAEQHSITPLPTPIYGFAVIATGPGAGVEGGNGGATVQPSGRGSTTVRTSGPSAKVTIR